MNLLFWTWVFVAFAWPAVAVVLALFIAYNLRDIKYKLDKLLKREPEPQKPSIVTPLPPGYSDVNKASSVVTPKSPAQVEREAEQRIRDLNR